MIEKLEKEGFSDVIRHKTGLIPDAYFSATKICWILDHTEGAREEAQKGNLLFGTVDTWLIWKLTKGEVHVTDYTNASRCCLTSMRSTGIRKSWIILGYHFPCFHRYGQAAVSMVTPMRS